MEKKLETLINENKKIDKFIINNQTDLRRNKEKIERGKKNEIIYMNL